MKAIIIGAGIAGLTTAIALSRYGINSDLYERAERLTEIGAGISLWANALEILATTPDESFLHNDIIDRPWPARFGMG